jgi:hypothetical protein
MKTGASMGARFFLQLRSVRKRGWRIHSAPHLTEGTSQKYVK